MMVGKSFFFIFESIPIPALNIKSPTASLMPRKASATIFISIKLLRKQEMIYMIRNEGRMTPSVAAKAPFNPFIL